MQRDRCAYRVQRLTLHGQIQCERIATLLDAQALRRVDVEFYILRIRAALTPILQGSHSRAVDRRSGIDSTAVEALTKHQYPLAMRIRIVVIGNWREVISAVSATSPDIFFHR